MRRILLAFGMGAAAYGSVITPPTIDAPANANWVFFAADLTATPDSSSNAEGNVLFLAFPELPTATAGSSTLISDSAPVAFTQAPTAVPEPAPAGVMIAGCALCYFAWRRSRSPGKPSR